MHLSNVLTGHGFDYKAVVVAGQEAVAEATLGVAVEWGAPRQRVLGVRHPDTFLLQRGLKTIFIHQSQLVCIFSAEETDLVVLVIDAEPLPQVSEHHGTVFFEFKATRQVFSGKKETELCTVSKKKTKNSSEAHY